MGFENGTKRGVYSCRSLKINSLRLLDMISVASVLDEAMTFGIPVYILLWSADGREKGGRGVVIKLLRYSLPQAPIIIPKTGKGS